MHRRNHLKYAIIIILSGGILITGYFWFHRIPDRVIPDGPVITSPANGRVIAIESIPDNTVTFLKGDTVNSLRVEGMDGPLTIIVIEMNLHNVHVQRAPFDGEIIYQKHTPGLFKNAIFSKDKKRLENTNEKELTIFESEDGTRIGVIQVAGFLARRIENWEGAGATLAQGEPYGMIKLGSQVVVIMPVDVKPSVELDQKVIDGETMIGVPTGVSWAESLSKEEIEMLDEIPSADEDFDFGTTILPSGETICQFIERVGEKYLLHWEKDRYEKDCKK
jgi:phosphatidylserine decarboxylase